MQNRIILVFFLILIKTTTAQRETLKTFPDDPINLANVALSDSNNSNSEQGLLQASGDVFLRKATFDLGVGFFRVRGYDANSTMVTLNGIVMNKFLDGRPQWNNWGGLNDISRNQERSYGLASSTTTFGKVLGAININLRPSQMRPGTRLSSSASNRTYSGRLMATRTIQNTNGISYTFSASRRWASQGYVDGTLYDAYSGYGALEYQFKDKHSVTLTTILASNRRGRSAPLTTEVFELVGRQYNPYWGDQNGTRRNAREQKIQEPIVLLNYFYNSEKFDLSLGAAYQFGKRSRSRLGFFDAPNPDPVYYRYLPSFYINSPLGANFIGANQAEAGFLANPQLSWRRFYNANASNGGKAAYVLYDDIIADNQISFNLTGNLKLNDWMNIDFGISNQLLNSDNYAKIKDLLGAEFHEDIDTFSNTRNDLEGILQKGTGAIFNYNYNIKAIQTHGFSQVRFSHKNWSGSASITYGQTAYQRKGRFKNDRFTEGSIGNSPQVKFSNLGIKAGLLYKVNGRHWLAINALHTTKPPTLQNTFINPRENNQVVPKITNEKVLGAEGNYFLRLPNLKGRFSTYYSQFDKSTDVNFFFVESGVGSDFVQEVISNLSKRHYGIEIGLEYQLSPTVKFIGAGAWGNYSYANNPNVTINFDTAGNEEELINVEGNIDLGSANLRGYRLGQGPQTAYSLGIEYRDPNYWWLGTTINYLGDNYINISSITRTQSFFLNPETGLRFPEATDAAVNMLLQQLRLDDFYVLNFVGGKSWRVSGKYISAFVSVSNALNINFKTGGFEQSRNGNFGELAQDNLSGNPTFGPKFWYGRGRTYFINLAINF